MVAGWGAAVAAAIEIGTTMLLVSSIPMGRPTLRRWVGFLLSLWALTSTAQDPFKVRPALKQLGDNWTVHIEFEVPSNHRLYAEQLAVHFSEGGRLEDVQLPTPNAHFEAVSAQARLVYDHSFQATRSFGPALPEPITLTVHYQGCEGNTCFLPRSRRWRLAPGAEPQELDLRDPEDETPLPGSWKTLAEGSQVAGKGGGLPTETTWMDFIKTSVPSVAEDEVLTSVARSRLFLFFGGASLALAMGLRRFMQVRRPASDGLFRWTSVGLLLLSGALITGFLRERWPQTPRIGQGWSLRAERTDSTETQLTQALVAAQAKGRPVLMIFWASWSEPCSLAMKTLKSPQLIAPLQQLNRVDIQVDDLQTSPIRELCSYFSIRSLPAYLVLVPKSIEPGLGALRERSDSPFDKP